MKKNNLSTKLNERIDDLQLNGLKIIQKADGYAFTSDSVLLANFVKAKKSDNLLEIGAGTGIISILVNEKQKPQSITALEIMPEYASLCQRNVEYNGIKNISVVCDSLQNYAKVQKNTKFDIIFSNPPYFDSKTNGKCENKERQTARFDSSLPLDEFAKCCKKLIKFGGKLYFIYSSSRLQEVFFTLKQHSFAIKKCCLIYPNNTKNANTCLFEATYGGKDGLIVLPPIFTNDLSGNYVETIQKLFGTKKETDL